METVTTGAHVLVIGDGGREHALAWKLAQSPHVRTVSVAPGNGGTPNNVPLAATDVEGLLTWAAVHKPDLTVVGPEAALAAGIVDQFTAAGLRIFGPTRAAAQLETSKVFAKQFMQRHAIPTAPFEIFDNSRAALRYLIMEGNQPLAIKADGLAAGKGVYVTDCAHDAEVAVRALMDEHTFGDAGARIVIEKALSGYEISLMAFADGKTMALMPLAQDHKRIGDGDTGPNTGGMGAYAPAVCPPELAATFPDLIGKALNGLQQEGLAFRGVLFAGLMVTPTGVYVLEYNCRLGDPETQAVLPLLDNDLYDVLMGNAMPIWKTDQHAVAVVMAAGGYPGVSENGKPISGLDRIPGNLQIFQAGTRREGDQIITAGGRVLSVACTGNTLRTALDRAYTGVRAIHFDGAQYRTDIGAKAGTQA